VGVAGLVLNIVGTVLLFFFAFPQPAHDDSPSLGLEDGTPVEGGTVAEVRERAQRTKVIYRGLALLGLTLLLLGFVLQLIEALVVG
jgi:hypothetical protein